jgi:hypothetical protein
MAVQAAADTTSLLTTLATALLAALGLLLTNRNENRPKLRHRWSALLTAASAGISLYYGYVKHLYLLTMINSSCFDPHKFSFVRANYLQFYPLLVGFFFLADFVFHDFLEGEVM